MRRTSARSTAAQSGSASAPMARNGEEWPGFFGWKWENLWKIGNIEEWCGHTKQLKSFCHWPALNLRMNCPTSASSKSVASRAGLCQDWSSNVVPLMFLFFNRAAGKNDSSSYFMTSFPPSAQAAKWNKPKRNERHRFAKKEYHLMASNLWFGSTFEEIILWWGLRETNLQNLSGLPATSVSSHPIWLLKELHVRFLHGFVFKNDALPS